MHIKKWEELFHKDSFVDERLKGEISLEELVISGIFYILFLLDFALNQYFVTF